MFRKRSTIERKTSGFLNPKKEFASSILFIFNTAKEVVDF